LVVRCSCDSPRGAAPTGGGGACGACVGAPPRGEAVGLRCSGGCFAAGRRSYGGCDFLWEPRPGAKLMVCGVPEDASRRGAAPTGGGGACGVCVGAPPRGEAFGCAVLLRFAARRGSYRGGGACGACVGAPPRGEAFGCAVFRRMLRGGAPLLRGAVIFCGSPAPGRSVWLCGALAIRREARLLQGEAVPVVLA